MVVTSSHRVLVLGCGLLAASLALRDGELVTRYDPDEVACFRAKL